MESPIKNPIQMESQLESPMQVESDNEVESSGKTNRPEVKPKLIALDSAQQTPEQHLSSNPEAVKEKHSPSVFVNSEPIREDQVQNAVNFLAHPKVRGSPVMYRRSFLERKGLTKEEIDEAFRRVPDPTPTASSTESAIANQELLKTSSNIQPQALIQSTQPAQASAVGSMTKVGYLSQFHWSHALLAVGLLAASGSVTAVFFKKSIIPRLKSWIRKVVLEEEEDETEEGAAKGKRLKPSLAEETAAAAKAAAAAASDVARASQDMLASKTEEKKMFKEFTDLLSYQVREMKSMTSAIQKLEGPNNISGRPPLLEQDHRKNSLPSSQQFYGNGKVDNDARSVRSLSPPASVEPSGPPHPKSYMEIMEMVNRGERPSNIRDINDQPPNPHQPVPEPALAPKPKPWEVGQSQPQYNGGSSSSSSTPWWQHNSAAKITEIEPEEDRPALRSWVPPLPPPVSMAEAAAAIRQPKKSSFQKDQANNDQLQKDQMNDDQLPGRGLAVSDELQTFTKISESGGVAVEEDNGSMNQTLLADNVATWE